LIKNAYGGVSNQSVRNQVYDNTIKYLPSRFTKDTLHKKNSKGYEDLYAVLEN